MSNFWVENTSICSSFSVQFSHSVMSNSLWPHGLQQARPPFPSPTPGVCSNSRPSSQWCHPTVSSSVIPFSSCLHSFPASESFQMSQFFISGDKSIGASASVSVLPRYIQVWFPLALIGLISLQSKGHWRIFSNTTVKKNHSNNIYWNIHWKDWCWSWSSNTLVTWCEEPGKDPDLGKDPGSWKRS